MKSSSLEVVNTQSEEGKHIDIDNFKFVELVANATVSLQDEYFRDTAYPATVSLLACSGKYGYFVSGHIEGFVFGQTKSLRSTFYATEEGCTSSLEDRIIVPLNLPAHQIRLSCDEQTIIVALCDGTVFSYWAKDILEQKKDAQPKHSICFNTPIIDLRPNTGAQPDSACVLLKDNVCRIINWKTGETVADMPGLYASAICWSPKGKRIICGGSNGTLEHYDLNGVKQYSVPRPESLKGENVNWIVQGVLWIENDQFLVLYTRSDSTESDGSINAGYIIDRNPTNGTTPKYTRLAKLPPVIPADRVYNHFYLEIIRDSTHPIIILANSASNLISVVGQDKNGNWATCVLPENGMASLPLSEEEAYCTVPLGLALDFAVCEKLPSYDAIKSASVGVIEPMPVLYCINDEGFIDAFHCYHQDLANSGTKYQQMQTAIALPSNPDSQSTSAFSSDPFDVAMKSGYSGKGFASLEKVQGATSPTFGFSSFGQLNASQPVFGSTTSFGASSTTSSSPKGPSSSSSPSEAAATKPTTANNSTTKSGPSGSNEFAGVDTVENSKSTSSNSSSTGSSSSFEMVDKNDIGDSSPRLRFGATFSPYGNKSTSTKQAEHGDLHSKAKGDDQLVPNTKPESDTTDLATNSNKSELKSPSVTNTKPSPFSPSPFIFSPNSFSFASNSKADNTSTKTPSPNTNTFSFGLATPFADLAKKNAPNTTGRTATMFADLAKKNTPMTTGTTPTFGSLAKTNAPATTGTTPTFADLAKKNTPATTGTTPTFGSLVTMNSQPKVNASTPPTSIPFTLGHPAKKNALRATDTKTTARPPCGTPENKHNLHPRLPSSHLVFETNYKPSPPIFPSLPSSKDLQQKLAPSNTITTSNSIQSATVENDESQNPYSKIMAVVEKMAATQADFQEQLQNQSKQLDNLTKNVEYLTDSLKQWQSMESDQMRVVPQMKLYNVKDQGSSISPPDSGLTKEDQSKQALTTVNGIDDIGRLECKDGDNVLAEMQFRITDNKKGKQQETNTRDSSFYDFRVAIQEMEQELQKKDEDIMELKQLLALLRFREYQRKAQYSQSTIAFEDLTDDDDSNDNNAGSEGQDDSTLPPTDNATEHTTAATTTTKRVDEDRSLGKSTDQTRQ